MTNEEIQKINQAKAEYQKRYRQEHLEQCREYNRKYRKKHRKQLNAYQREYRKQHREKYSEQFKEYQNRYWLRMYEREQAAAKLQERKEKAMETTLQELKVYFEDNDYDLFLSKFEAWESSQETEFEYIIDDLVITASRTGNEAGYTVFIEENA